MSSGRPRFLVIPENDVKEKHRQLNRRFLELPPLNWNRPAYSRHLIRKSQFCAKWRFRKVPLFLPTLNVVTLIMGERSAVRPKSGKSVHQSDPGLRRPTPPATAGRKPEARPPVSTVCRPEVEIEDFESRAAGLFQPKTGRGAGWNPATKAQREALGSLKPSVDRDAGALDACNLESLDDYSVRQLLEFFEILDRWDREAHGKQTM